MHIPKKVVCPICGNKMSGFGTIGPEGATGGGNLDVPLNNPMKQDNHGKRTREKPFYGQICKS